MEQPGFHLNNFASEDFLNIILSETFYATKANKSVLMALISFGKHAIQPICPLIKILTFRI